MAGLAPYTNSLQLGVNFRVVAIATKGRKFVRIGRLLDSAHCVQNENFVY